MYYSFDTTGHTTTTNNLLHIILLIAEAGLVTPNIQGGPNVTGSLGSLGYLCRLTDFIHTARCHYRDANLLCEMGISTEWLRGVHHHIHHLTILEWPGHCLNVDPLQLRFPELRELAFINSTSVTNFKGHFSSLSKIERLVINGLTSLFALPPDFVGYMQYLKELDLRRNGLRHLRSRTIRGPHALQNVYLSENKWDCSDSGLDWLAFENENGTARQRIADYERLICNQQLYRGKPLHKVMDIIRTVRETCPAPCACAMTHVVSDRAGAIIPLITVDCAARLLTSPPTTLPPSTTTLRLEGNKINSIRTILHNPEYMRLVDLYLDNNSIPSVKELEGSEWFNKFRVLSLRGNMLKQIPVYAFDKAFQSNNNIMHVFLGHNPWRCDCHYTPRFQALLLKYKRVIRDLPDIRCSESDQETALMQISSMSLGIVCKSGTGMPISTVNIINIVLLALLLLVLGRFMYDWRSFKKTGKLPWVSSILP